MGASQSSIYNNILKKFQENHALTVIESSKTNVAKIYRKSVLESPITLINTFEQKDGHVKLIETNYPSCKELINNIIKNFKDEIELIEELAGKSRFSLQDFYYEVQIAFDKKHEFGEDGIYNIHVTFQPFISMHPGFYKMYCHIRTIKTNEYTEDKNIKSGEKI